MSHSVKSQIRRIGVIGAGQMGSGIAQVSAASGYEALLWDVDSSAVDRALQGVSNQLTKLVEKEKISEEKKQSTLSNLSAAKDLSAFKGCDLIVEAIVENFDIKAKLWRELDSLIPSSCLFASNTSSISITKMAACTKRPEQFIGMHFMNPVPVMKLVEVIRGLQTSDETLNTISQIVQTMGKTLVLAKDSPGFIVNRILGPMINEAVYLLQEGLKPLDIDNGMLLGTNQPMGPLALADFIGLDTCLAILQVLHSEIGEDKYRPCPLLVKYVEAGWLGKKTKRGFYSY